MSAYAEPEFYRMNEDSLRLVSYVARSWTGPGPRRLLDLGAGSGVIGIELANLLAPDELTLLELQPEWGPYLEANVARVLRAPTRAKIELVPLGEWNPPATFELIVCNPPYFLPGHGKPSPDLRRDLCRSFTRDGWAALLATIDRALAPTGAAYLVVRDDARILRELERHRRGPATVSQDGGLAFVTLSGCRST